MTESPAQAKRTTQVTFYLDTAQKAALREYARRERTLMTWVIEDALSEYMKRRNEPWPSEGRPTAEAS